ncbi:ArsR/SmtB family transcription factor [Herbaspirillum rhizosphaerae]|uniref:ArsR/SmtB family transcription factor n=1 Tax=Herbaspirillum rhizosphaerae TaxID=346179 RepID=UPI00067DFE3A|nr:metalloregulator ArsR/SmtB family transcription factor [Herbaspirillum rhizosphaerae]
MPPDHLSATFSALADPTRRAILARLASGEASVKELMEPFEMTPPAITKHLKVLERAGLITRGRAAQWRPCKLEARPLHEVHAWIDQYRQFWEASLDRLEDYLRDLQAKTENPLETDLTTVKTQTTPQKTPSGKKRTAKPAVKK